MAAVGLAMIAGAWYATSPSVPSRTTTPAEAVPAPPHRAPGVEPAALVERARALMALGQIAEAAHLLDAAVDADPADAGAWNALGVALVRRGELVRGTEALARGIAVAPRLAEAHKNLAVALDRGGDAAGAVRHYRAFLQWAAPADAARADVARRLGELGGPPDRAAVSGRAPAAPAGSP